MHLGDDSWVIVDSCINSEGRPRALEYLESIGVNPAKAVDVVVATHWYDDHIRGIATVVEICNRAEFCCANTLLNSEFLAAINALEARHRTSEGWGVREIYHTLKCLQSRSCRPKFAAANRKIHSQGNCDIWSLSPSDVAFQNFLRSVGTLFPREGQAKSRIPSISPNDFSVVLWINIEDVVILLGSDLEQDAWTEILHSEERPPGEASTFKVPHHGSEGADDPRVWQRLLASDPNALVTPWQRAGRALPTQRDVYRILSYTPNAYASARMDRTARSPRYPNRTVARTIRSTGIKLRELNVSSDAIRLRQSVNASENWQIETFGTACHLRDFVVK